MKKMILGSWKTSLCGLLLAGPQLANAISSGNKITLFTGIVTILFGLFSKDGNQTHSK